MIDTSPEKLLEEVTAAERWRDDHLDGLEDRLKRYTGPAFKKAQRGDYDPENHAFEYLSLLVPRLVYANPAVKIESKRLGESRTDARVLQFGTNQWIRDVNLKRDLEKLAVDTCFVWGVAVVSLGEKPGYGEPEDPRTLPHVFRKSPRHYVCDPLALSPEEFRWQGHKTITDKESLIEWAKAHPDEGWDIEVIESMAVDTGRERLSKDTRSVPERDEIAYYEVWVPEHELEESKGSEEGYHGTIFTLACEYAGSSVKGLGYPRKPRPYYGPRWGPYVLFGVYTVPDCPLPLSPLTAVEPLVLELNDQVRAANSSAKSYKRLIFVDATDATIQDKVKNSPHDFVIPLNGLDKNKLVAGEIGGTTEQQAGQIAMMRERLDRNAGMDDANRGTVTGDGTATEVAVASEASATRVGFIAQKFEDGVERVLKTVAWYLYHEETIEFPLGPEAAEEFGLEEPIYKGGVQGGRDRFDELDVTIEAYSMERTSVVVQEKRAMNLVTFLTSIAPLMPQMPWIDWSMAIEDVAEALDLPDLVPILNAQALQQATQAMAEQQAQAAAPPSRGASSGRSSAPPPIAAPKPAPQPGGLPGRSSGNKAQSKVKALT